MNRGTLTFARLALHWYVLAVVLSTLVLICSGGLVTSKGVGMAVPDWPNTYGYNMFTFPISRWVGGVFYEHTHRLIASGVGLLTFAMTVWMFFVEPRRWVKILGVIASFAVLIQGILGGLRVTLIKDEIGIFHGILAQSFLLLLAILFLVTGPGWLRAKWSNWFSAASLRKWALAATILIFLQLVIGASMRHEHAGLSIPDFPAAYGKVWPPMDQASIAAINEQRLADNKMPTNAHQIGLQMIHRIGALAVLLAVSIFCWKVFSPGAPLPTALRRVAALWFALICVQITLGAYTIWTDKAADIATAHVFVGALLLLTGGLVTFWLFSANKLAPREQLAANVSQSALPESAAH